MDAASFIKEYQTNFLEIRNSLKLIQYKEGGMEIRNFVHLTVINNKYKKGEAVVQAKWLNEIYRAPNLKEIKCDINLKRCYA